VRCDGKYYCKFDQAHKVDKVHRRQYQREGKNVPLIQGIDTKSVRVMREVIGHPESWFEDSEILGE
jgi:hypothetical protein